MKKIGLLGGMRWESSANYCKIINEEVKKQLGGLHSARVVLNSIDFEPIEQLQHKGDWEATAKILAKEAKSIEDAGSAVILGCTEIAMLVNQNDTEVKLYDTTTIHAKKAVEMALVE